MLVLGSRDGLTSCKLFFLDRFASCAERADGRALKLGLLGDDSREGIGEFLADVARLGWNLFVDTEDVEESRPGREVFRFARSRDAALIVSAVSCAVLDADGVGCRCLSSMVVAVLAPQEGHEGTDVNGVKSNRAATSRMGWTPQSLVMWRVPILIPADQ